MRTNITISLVLWVLALANLSPVAAHDEKTTAHNWEYIAYPELPALPDGSLVPNLVIQNGKDQGLQFTLSYYVSKMKGAPRKEPPSWEKISVRLHSADGKITDPEPDTQTGPSEYGNARGASFSYNYQFPWRRNILEEAWIEVRLPEQVYWVEIPYGFTRNPEDRLNPVDVGRDRPELPTALKLGKNVRLVPWLHVHYDLGTIQNQWHLSVNLANPFDAEAEIVLYRDDLEEGKSIYLWDLHSPRTAIAVKQPAEPILESKCMSIRLHDDGLRRSDYFEFNRNPCDEGRCWGTVNVKVDDKSYEFVIPSSLFKYVHGIADPYNQASVPRKSDR